MSLNLLCATKSHGIHMNTPVFITNAAPRAGSPKMRLQRLICACPTRHAALASSQEFLLRAVFTGEAPHADCGVYQAAGRGVTDAFDTAPTFATST